MEFFMPNVISKSDQFVRLAAETLRELELKSRRVDDTVVYWLSRRDCEAEFCVWFEEATNRAVVCALAADLFQPEDFERVRRCLGQLPQIDFSVGSRLGVDPKGHLRWSSYCQLSPDDEISASLVCELISIGVNHFAILLDAVIDEFACDCEPEDQLRTENLN
jgi:hypothetical protein